MNSGVTLMVCGREFLRVAVGATEVEGGNQRQRETKGGHFRPVVATAGKLVNEHIYLFSKYLLRS